MTTTMRLARRARLPLLAAAWIAVALPTLAADRPSEPVVVAANRPSEQLVVSGRIKNPLSLTVADLRALPAAQIESVQVMRGPPDHRVQATVKGVRLTALLEQAALAAADHNDWKHTVVLATATDGYQVVFSWPELFDTDVGAGALVVFERDGEPLPDREGRIALVSARDKHPGPRSVRSLAALEVRLLE